MRKLKLIVNTSILILVFQFNLYGQEAVVVHSNVGILIDSSENSRYLLFPEYSFEEFLGAQVFKYDDKQYKLVIYLHDNKTVSKELTVEDYKKLKNKISNFKNDYCKGDTSVLYSISLNDGSVVMGKIIKYEHNFIKLNSETLHELSIKPEKITEIQSINDKEYSSKLLGKNPHYSRYLYAPSAMPLNKGEGYFQDIYLIFVSTNYAVSDHTTIGAGFSILPGVDIDEQVFFLNAKVAYPVTDKFYLGGGGLYFGIGDLGGSIGIGYAVGTYGSKDHNVTLGVGYGYTDNELMETPVFTLCGMTRISKRISLMTENWFITVSYDEDVPPDYNTTRQVREFQSLISYGLRFFGDKLSVDLAFMNLPTEGEWLFPGVPYIDFVVRF